MAGRCSSSWTPGPPSSPGRASAPPRTSGGWPSAPTLSSSTPWSWPGRCGPSAAPPCRCCGGSTMPLRATPTSPTRSPRSWPRTSGCTRWATTPPTPCTPSGPISRSASSSTACPTMRRRISPAATSATPPISPSLPPSAPLSAGRATTSSAPPSGCCRRRCGTRPPSSSSAWRRTRR